MRPVFQQYECLRMMSERSVEHHKSVNAFILSHTADDVMRASPAFNVISCLTDKNDLKCAADSSATHNVSNTSVSAGPGRITRRRRRYKKSAQSVAMSGSSCRGCCCWVPSSKASSARIFSSPLSKPLLFSFADVESVNFGGVLSSPNYLMSFQLLLPRSSTASVTRST